MKPVKTGIFGGSFDPAHIGHRKLAESYLASGEIEELWITPTPVPPHKETDSSTNASMRFELAKATFHDIPNCFVSDLEFHLSAPHYTFKTLEHARTQFPDREFLLCIGQDSINNFSSWKNYQLILDHTTILVAVRPKEGERKLDFPESVKFIPHKPIAVSSSDIREQIKEDTSEEWRELLTREAVEIIDREQLYR